MTLEYLYQQQH